ncbi:MAG TPA: hypothetical protein VJH55_01945 [Candidatus Paceibacterota bacterium]
MDKSAEEILALKPDIVLMDQGLIDFDGSDLVRCIRTMSSKQPYYVANTGGSDRELRNEGAFTNCDKGKNLVGVMQAIECLKEGNV